jgi:predicted small metal-binding protein
MAKVINCPCGYTVRGDSDEALLAEAHKHIESEHPDKVGSVSDEELIGSAQEE